MITDYQYIYDAVVGPVNAVISGAECVSYLAVGYKYGSYNFDGTTDVDGFVSTYDNYLQWADAYYPDGSLCKLLTQNAPVMSHTALQLSKA